MTEPRFRRDGAWIGASVPRREDPRLLAGRGRFVDDIVLPGMLHAQFVRSTVANGRIVAIDLHDVRKVPGVVAAFSAADLGLGDITALLDRPPHEFVPTAMPVLAHDKVRFVGEPVAIVIARDPYAAEDGLEAAVVEYEELDPVVTDTAALADGAPLVHAEAPRNTLVDVSLFATEGIDDVFAEAPCVVRVQTKTGRQNALPLETRGVVADWDDRDEQLRVQINTQIPHQVRTVLASCVGLVEKQVRVTVPDMGGGFGQKCVVGREEIATAAAALRLRRPVKWIEDRRDALTAAFLAREQRYDVRAAFDDDGRILALDADVVCDMGAYSCYPFTAGIEPLMASAEMPSVYKVPAYRVRGRAVTTNKAPTGPYRGVSRPQYVMVVERLMERAARELDMDPVEIRRRNLITVFPYTGVNRITYDPGSYRESLDLCEQVLRDEGWYDVRDSDRVIGIGYACFSERTGYGSGAFAQRKMQVVPGFDISEIRMDVSGTVSVTTGTMSHGQSHETTMAQIVADRLGLDIAQVKIVQGDTDRITYGFGSFASRSITIGGSAVAAASEKLGDQLREIAAHLLDADVDSTELDGAGGVRLRDDPARRLSFAAARRRRLPARAPAAQGRRPRADGHRELRRGGRRHVLQRHPRRGRRAGPGHRRRADPAVRVRGGLRGGDPPADRRGAVPRRDRAGHRRCAVRAGHLRRRRAAAGAEPDGVQGADRRRDPRRRDPPPRDAVRVHRERRQGRGGGRHDRRARRRAQRRERRAARHRRGAGRHPDRAGVRVPGPGGKLCLRSSWSSSPSTASGTTSRSSRAARSSTCCATTSASPAPTWAASTGSAERAPCSSTGRRRGHA